jgi:hypothetical protein
MQEGIFAILPESGDREGEGCADYSVANVRLIWLQFPFEQSSETRAADELAAMVSAAMTSGSAE